MTLSHLFERGDRSFDFGRCELSHEKPWDAVACGDSIILAVHEGAVMVEVGDTASRLEPRTCALFTGGESLAVVLSEGAGAAILWCKALGRDLADRPLTEVHRAVGDPLALSDQIDALMRLGVKVEKDTDFEEGLRHALGVAVFSTYQAHTNELAITPMPASVRKTRDYIDQNCQRAADLSSLAAIAGITREHLNVVFRRHVGFTPMRYLWNVRIQKAVRLVQGTDLNLASVAELCGFKSPFHLSREIKRATGRSPRDLRRPPAKEGASPPRLVRR